MGQQHTSLVECTKMGQQHTSLVQDEILLFLLQQFEKHEILIQTLRTRGFLNDNDIAVAEIESEVREAERLARVAAAEGDVAGAAEHTRQIPELRRKLDILKQTNPI